MYPYTAERRDVLENTPPEAQEISKGPKGPRAISRASGSKIPARGKSRGPMDNTISEEYVIQYIIPVASVYQEIHPNSVVNIDSVKINTSLIMMRE